MITFYKQTKPMKKHPICRRTSQLLIRKTTFYMHYTIITEKGNTPVIEKRYKLYGKESFRKKADMKERSRSKSSFCCGSVL